MQRTRKRRTSSQCYINAVCVLCSVREVLPLPQCHSIGDRSRRLPHRWRSVDPQTDGQTDNKQHTRKITTASNDRHERINECAWNSLRWCARAHATRPQITVSHMKPARERERSPRRQVADCINCNCPNMAISNRIASACWVRARFSGMKCWSSNLYMYVLKCKCRSHWNAWDEMADIYKDTHTHENKRAYQRIISIYLPVDARVVSSAGTVVQTHSLTIDRRLFYCSTFWYTHCHCRRRRRHLSFISRLCFAVVACNTTDCPHAGRMACERTSAREPHIMPYN